MEIDMEICVWADGTWCWLDEVNEMTHMSDDYVILSADCDSHADHIAEQVRTGSSVMVAQEVRDTRTVE